ncbi:MAG: omptin family outer membrane protease [Treponemataceae bacterium]|nr:omptin family outer membrane protease [Treponemataceae bacterium]
MQNKALKALVLLLALLPAMSTLWAEGLTFSVSPMIGQTEGLLQEYVLWDLDSDGIPEYDMSRLDWDITRRPFFGFSLGLNYQTSLQHRFSVSWMYATTKNSASGYMQDYDWQMLDGILTDYSKHNNTITDSYFYSVEGEWQTPLGLGFSVGWDICSISFEGTGGYAQHGYAHAGEPGHSAQPGYWYESMAYTELYPDTQAVIVYTLATNYLRTGITFTTTLLHPLDFTFGVWAIPLDAAVGTDGHYKFGKPHDWYRDSLYSTFAGYIGKARMDFHLDSHIILFMNLRLVRINKMHGTTESRTEPSKQWDAVGYGGAEYATQEYVLGVTYTF